MKKLTLKNCRQADALLLDHTFIDQYMPEANGEYVKVYLLLLRLQADPDRVLTVSAIADILDDTEKDVVRALKYWKKQGLLDYDLTEENSPAAGPAPAQEPPAQPDPAPGPQADAPPAQAGKADPGSREELRELLFIAEQYLGKTLSATEMKAITYFYDELGMSADLIEYLIGYCVENGHKSMHYIQKVALSWADRKITTPAQARQSAAFYSKCCFGVLKAYGITGRAPAAPELDYIRRWTGEYGFSDEMILEACRRTMNSIHQPSFDYTESILKSWLESGARSLKDVEALDLAHEKKKQARSSSSRSRRTAADTQKTGRNRFNNFEGRNYEDMDDLTRRLIQNQ